MLLVGFPLINAALALFVVATSSSNDKLTVNTDAWDPRN